MYNLSFEKVYELFNSLPSTDSAMDDFTSKIFIRSFKKNEIIKKYDAAETYLNIIEKGSVGLFIRKGDNDICTNLFYERDFFCDYLSLLKQQKTILKTVALENSKILSIQYTDMTSLYLQNNTSIQIARGVAENLFIKKQEEQIDLLTLTAEERYNKLIQKRPDILLRTPLKVIASYLGVTPESLSRLRKRTLTK